MSEQVKELQDQIATYDGAIQAMEANGIPDIGQYNATRADRDAAMKKLEAIEGEIKAGIEAQEQLYSLFDSIDVGGGTVLTLRELAANETAYQILSAFFQGYVGDQAQKHAAIESSYKSQNDKLLEDLQELESVRKRNADLDNKCADFEAKRDAAADELFQAQEEVKRLSADNESLRKQLEATAKPVQTNLNTNLAELAKQWAETKPAIYNKRWQDENRKTHYIATLAETGEEITIPWMELGKYKEVQAEEAETFRKEAEQAAAENVVQDSPLVSYPTVPDFTFQEEEPAYIVDEHEIVRSDDAPATLGELKALEARIALLEQSQRSVA